MPALKFIRKYERYPEYKDSGVEWIGDVPKAWGVFRAKNLFKKMNRAPLAEDEIVTAFRDGAVTLRKNRREDGFTMADLEIGYQRIEKGDLVIHGMDSFAGAIGVSDSDGKASPVYSVCKPIGDSDARYHAYLLRHMAKSKYIFALAKGIRERSTEFRFKEFGSLFVSEPPQKEQQKIAQYLDEKTASIDQIIEKKQKLIELLREKRTAVINHAVTKGLDLKAELVESGIDWIGKIPKGWEIRKLKSGFIFEKGKESGKFTQEFVGAEENVGIYPVYSGQTENNGVLGSINTFKYDYPQGVLFSTTVGAKAMTTKFLTGKFSLSQNCVLMIPSKKADSSYFNYLLEIGFKRMRDNIPSHMQPSLRVSDLNKFVVLFPALEEQRKIAEYLNLKCEIMDHAMIKIYGAIEKLQEFKSSLIFSVVTGKIKV